MPTPSEFSSRRGTVPVTFTQTGTYSTVVNMAGLRLVGLYSDGWPGGAGSLTFRASWDGAGTGYPIQNEAGVPYRVTSFGSQIYFDFTPGTVISPQYVSVQVGTAGTAGIAAGGTIVLIGEVDG